MGILAAILDWKTGETASVDSDRSLLVNQKRLNTIIFSEYLKDSAGSSQMAITTGTLAAPVEFYISADATYDLLITELSFVVAGASAALNEFGTGTALTNGCRLYYQDSVLGDIQINPIVYSNFDLVRFSSFNPSFGDGTTAFTAQNAIGTDEIYPAVVDLTRKMPNGKGILLKKNSKNKLVMQIRDNTFTAKASLFNCIVSGEKLP